MDPNPSFVCSRNIQWLDSCSQKLHFRICSFELTLLNKQFQSRKILEEAHLPPSTHTICQGYPGLSPFTVTLKQWKDITLSSDSSLVCVANPPVKTGSSSADILCLGVCKSPVCALVSGAMRIHPSLK